MSEDNIVYIGRKPAMTYVMAVLATFNNQETDKVLIKARGRAITTAVDVAEITRNRYLTSLEKPTIEIGTEEVEDGDQKRNVSSMTIALKKGEGAEEEPVAEEEETPSSDVSSISGVGEATAKLLEDAGYSDVEGVKEATPEELAEKTGLSEKQASNIIEAAKEV
ncbi:DNA-binding protein Alba [Candidatus Bathyarchaeota archaeon]|nr:DNA-binding protein Alba [Candidatus Bathyarchaeota archaeon]